MHSPESAEQTGGNHRPGVTATTRTERATHQLKIDVSTQLANAPVCNTLDGTERYNVNTWSCQAQAPNAVDLEEEDSDVFSPAGGRPHPDHMFFLSEDEFDDEDRGADDDGDDEECDSIAPYADGFHSSQCSTSEEQDSDSENTLTHNLAKNLLARLDTLVRDNSSGISIAGRARSRRRLVGRPVRRSNTPPAIARPQTFAGLPVRTHVGTSCGAIRLSSSCPAAFSSRWSELELSLASQNSRLDEDAEGKTSSTDSGRLRLRRNTISSKPDHETLVENRSHETVGHDPVQPSGLRNRCYSESDVQQLLMKEVGRQLRRMSDDFAFSHSGKLATVSESASEHDDIDYGDPV